MYEMLIQIVEDYKRVYIRKPTYDIRHSTFYEVSYAKWAMDKLLEYIYSHPAYPIEDSICEFADKMDEYACYGGDASYMFSVACNTAINFYDYYVQRTRIH